MHFVMNRAKMPELGNAWEGCIISCVFLMGSISIILTESNIICS